MCKLFNLFWVFRLDVQRNMNSLLFGAFFASKASLLWHNGVKVVLFKLFERNQRIFEGKNKSSFECLSIAKFKVSQWCALSNLFENYSPNLISSNWEAFVPPLLVLCPCICYCFVYFSLSQPWEFIFLNICVSLHWKVCILFKKSKLLPDMLFLITSESEG